MKSQEIRRTPRHAHCSFFLYLLHLPMMGGRAGVSVKDVLKLNFCLGTSPPVRV